MPITNPIIKPFIIDTLIKFKVLANVNNYFDCEKKFYRLNNKIKNAEPKYIDSALFIIMH
ncbi:MAG: hypothetical protein IIT37_06220, partial [Bacteroidales bacterium]|nr:hypothetical protein [Bacteroidales bacterium]